MALIKCRTCGGAVSREAEPPCPHCKDPYVTEERKRQKEEGIQQTVKEWEAMIDGWKERDRPKRIMSERRRRGLCEYCGGPVRLCADHGSLLVGIGPMRICDNKCGEVTFREDGEIQHEIELRKQRHREEQERRAEQERKERVEREEREEQDEVKNKKQYTAIVSGVICGVVSCLLAGFLATEFATDRVVSFLVSSVGICVGILTWYFVSKKRNLW